MTGVLERPLRVLSVEFLIRTNSPELFERLDYIAVRAEQGLPLVRRSTIEAMWTGGAFRLSGEGWGTDEVGSLPDAFDRLAAGIMQAALAEFPRAILVHAASIRHRDHMVLLVGAKRAGKTTLASHLMLQGFDVAGDELVLLEDGIATPVPRPFYLRACALALLPGLDDACRGAPFTISPTDGRMIALDPARLGRRWQVGPAPVSACIHIEPRHGGDSTIAPCSALDLVRRVLPQCLAPARAGQAPGTAWVTDLCRTVMASHRAVLHLGDLETASVAIRDRLP